MSIPSVLPDVFTVSTLSERWRVSQASIYRRIRACEIEAFKVGGSVRIRADVVEELENRNAYGTPVDRAVYEVAEDAPPLSPAQRDIITSAFRRE